MAKILNVLSFGLSGLLFGGKAKPQASPPPLPTRDDAAAATRADDDLLRRRGSAADMLTGTRGAEAAQGTVGKLIAGS